VAALVAAGPAMGAQTLIGNGVEPSVLVDRAGTTHVAFTVQTGSDTRIAYRRRPAGAAGFTPEITLPFSDSTSFSGATLLQYPPGSDRLVAIVDRCCSSGITTSIATSDDGGATWAAARTLYDGRLIPLGVFGRQPGAVVNGAGPNPGIFLLGLQNGFQVLRVPFSLAGAPFPAAAPQTVTPDVVVDTSLAFDAAGQPYVSFLTNDATRSVARTALGGPDVLLSQGAGGSPAAGAQLAGGARGVLALLRGPTTLTSRPLGPGGAGPEVRVDSPEDPAGGGIGSYLATAPDGSFVVVYADAASRLVVATSPDGRAWTRRRQGPYTGGVQRPISSIGSSRGYVVWLDTDGQNRIFGDDITRGPSVRGVSPAQAYPGGLVTITGSGLARASVTIGGQPAPVVASDTEIQAYVPSLPAGPADVAVDGSVAGRVTVLAQPDVPPDPNAVVIPTGIREVYFDASLAIDPSTGATVGAGPIARVSNEEIVPTGHLLLDNTKSLSVNWDFGDGTTSRRPVSTHTYARAGTYNVKVSVSDGGTKSAVSTYRVVAPAASVPTVSGGTSTYAPRVYAGPPAYRVSPAVRRVTLPPVNISIPSQVVFNVGSARLRPESRRFLARVSRIVRRARVPTRVAGYTDSTGPAALNLRLSRERARSVRRYLAAKRRVKPGLLRAVGFGERYPLASNANEIGRQKNRRVVLTVRLPRGVKRF
jgi:outer membrane protein OmpA-like peptidoglycan-associated protein